MKARLYIGAFVGSAFAGAVISFLLNYFLVPVPADALSSAINNAGSGFGSGAIGGLLSTFMAVRAFEKRSKDKQESEKERS